MKIESLKTSFNKLNINFIDLRLLVITIARLLRLFYPTTMCKCVIVCVIVYYFKTGIRETKVILKVGCSTMYLR